VLNTSNTVVIPKYKKLTHNAILSMTPEHLNVIEAESALISPVFHAANVSSRNANNKSPSVRMNQLASRLSNQPKVGIDNKESSQYRIIRERGDD